MAPIRPIQYLKDIPGGSTFNPTPSTSTKTQPEVLIHVPQLGVLVIPPPNSNNVSPTLSGEVEVRLPVGYGRRRCLGIRVILVGWCRIDHSNNAEKDGRGVEADVISQQVLEIKDSCILEEGSQRSVEVQ